MQERIKLNNGINNLSFSNSHCGVIKSREILLVFLKLRSAFVTAVKELIEWSLKSNCYFLLLLKILNISYLKSCLTLFD